MFGKLLITDTGKKHFDEVVQKSYLWSKNEKIIAFSNNTDLVIEFFEQNLEHARHAENERLTYCACFTALIGGGLAVLNDLRGSPVSIVLSFILFLLSIFSSFLNERWSNTFERHITYAKGCYYILHCSAELDDLNLKEASEKIEYLERMQNGKSLDQTSFDKIYENSKCKEVFKLESDKKNLRLDTLPLYCFGINNPTKKEWETGYFWVDTRGTKQYFKGYYILISILIFLVMVYVCCFSWPILMEELSVILCLPKS